MRMPCAIAVLICLTIPVRARAQAPLPDPQAPPPPGAVPLPAALPNAPPPVFPQAEIERIVSPIALYPDPLLAQVLAAATYPQQIPDAARWADQHHYLQGPALASAIQNDQLPWDPSVQALLPFPSVLAMMAASMRWTEELGNAFLAQQQQVMDAVQTQRQLAGRYGYLQSNAQVVVTPGPYIEIRPVNPAYVVVPYYDYRVVYVPPRPGFYVAGAVRFGYGVNIGVAFAPWGWGASHVDWRGHVVVVNREPWRRTWANRSVYVHPYAIQRPPPAVRPPERHREIERTEREREAAAAGHERREEHKKEEKKEEKREEERKRGRGGDQAR